MNLDNLTPDTSSKLSFFLIILIMGIFGFIQDFIFSTKTVGSLSPVFLISFTIFACLVYLNYRYNEYRKFYYTETTEIVSHIGFFGILIVLVFFVVTPNSLIKLVGISTWMFIFSIVLIFVLLFLVAGIMKYKKLINGLITSQLNSYNSREDIKIRNFVSQNKDKLRGSELISKLIGFNYKSTNLKEIVFLETYEFPLI